MLNVFRLAGDFSHLVAILLLLLKIWTTRSCAGVSGKSQILFTLVYLTRYMDLLTTYISAYNSAMKLIFISVSLTTLYLIYVQYRATYDREQDSFSNEIIILSCLTFAFVINYNYVAIEVLWTFSIYLEAVAIVPQLYMVYKNGLADNIIGYYLLVLGSYRALYLANWVWRYVYEDHFDAIAVFAGLLQTFIYCVFLCWYVMHSGGEKQSHAEEGNTGDNEKPSIIAVAGESCTNIFEGNGTEQTIPAWKCNADNGQEISKKNEELAKQLENTLARDNGHYDAVYNVSSQVDNSTSGGARSITDTVISSNDR